MKPFATRREFLKTSLVAGVAVSARPLWGCRSANERLDVGVIGVANRGRDNLDAMEGENVVAICDVDEGNLAAAGEAWPKAKRYADFRKLFEGQRLDALVIGTPDHTHAAIALAGLDLGLAVYCEKPLTHSSRWRRRRGGWGWATGCTCPGCGTTSAPTSPPSTCC
jgi:hypothetical protein